MLEQKYKTGRLANLALASIGVVFGDIGTNPLFAIRQCVDNLGENSVQPEAIFGILSLIFWSLIVVVCIKYLGFVLYADHDGEGGTLALLALIHSRNGNDLKSGPSLLVLMVFFGSALLYGDGVITPAISVLSAVEGIKLVTPISQATTVTIAFVILALLFVWQHKGTAKIGFCFGPIMMLWFVTIAVLGGLQIAAHPRILEAANPLEALRFFSVHGSSGIFVLGGVVLCFAGAEALFADLGHFGRFPIKLAWYGLVLPSLILIYFGEGAFLLDHPKVTDSLFFAIVPRFVLIPVVVLATTATIIASQALISGVFSLTQQAITMGYFPRFKIIHTSEAERGQVYVPVSNYALMLACLVVVLVFQTSDSLGNAYGLSVIGTMTITSLVYFQVLRHVYNWSLLRSATMVFCFLGIDVLFLFGNALKIFSGAWVPVAIASAIFGLFWIWTMGRARYLSALEEWSLPLADFLREMKKWESRSAGTMIFLSPNPETVPLVGKNRWIRTHARNEQVVLIVVTYRSVPFVSTKDRLKVEQPQNGFFVLTASFGFLQEPNIGNLIKDLPENLIKIDQECRVFYLPEPTIHLGGSTMARLISHLFQVLRRNALSTADYYNLPPEDVVHVGVVLKV